MIIGLLTGLIIISAGFLFGVVFIIASVLQFKQVITKGAVTNEQKTPKKTNRSRKS